MEEEEEEKEEEEVLWLSSETARNKWIKSKADEKVGEEADDEDELEQNETKTEKK